MVLQIFFAWSGERYGFNLAKALTFWLTFTQSSCMCLFNLSLLSICIPRSFTVCVAGNFFPPMLRRRHLWSLRPRNMIWNFSGFAIIPFFANQSNRRPRSFSNLITISCIVLPHANMVLSSAKLHISDFRLMRNKSFIKMLKSNGPRTEPWGTPIFICCRLLLYEPIFTLWYRLCKKLNMSWRLSLLNPYASNFASSKA